jgi:thiol-disulfide isomerase/thioredoxin
MKSWGRRGSRAILSAIFVSGALLGVDAKAARGQIPLNGPLIDGRMMALHEKAPDFPPNGFKVSGTTWINSPPLMLAQLHGKVVMIDFWEYTCINCIRTFPQNKEWYARYQKYGFEIIGVHDPEFQIAYDVANVQAAVKRYELPYPIVVDDWYKIWKSYSNEAWPSRFLIDANGYVRFHIDGEGDDHNFEVAIRRLLIEAHPGLTFPADYTLPGAENIYSAACGGEPTPEMYVGPWDGRGIVQNRSPYHLGQTRDYKFPGNLDDGHAVISGKWETDPNGMIFEGKTQSPGGNASRMEMKYHATQVYAVMNVVAGKPERLYLLQDGKDLTSDNRGADVKIDENGRSYIDVDVSRMYYLTANKEFGSHTIDLIPTWPGIEIDSFTFGNNCQTEFPHL